MINRAVRLLTRIGGAAGGLAADLVLYALSAGFAALTAATSTLLPHRAWGAIAWWGYATASLAVVVQLLLRVRLPAVAGSTARAALTWTTWLAAAVLPMLIEAAQRAAGRTDRAQEEVLVVEQMGERLRQHGTPYVDRDAIAALAADDRLAAYSPYQPGMAVFGLPRAAFGATWWTDARIWFTLVTAAALLTAVLVLRGGATSPVRALQAATVLPICALTLATGGDDMPVLALCLLALALTATNRFGWAGIAAGAAAASKLFAFPVVAVLIVFALASPKRAAEPSANSGTGGEGFVEGGPGRPVAGHAEAEGRRPLPGVGHGAAVRRAVRLAAGGLGLPALTLIPPMLIAADGFVENVLRFPSGHGLVTSPAQSPFPGYLIAEHVPGWRLVTLGLLLAVAAALAVRVLRRPPTTATAAALICGWGLLAAILLMPTTRFGYLLYPIAFLAWAPSLTCPQLPLTQQPHSRTRPTA